MKIDPKTLNLVVPVETDTGTIYIHSTPIRRETFKEYFLVLSKTLNMIYTEGLHSATGPRVAALMLQKVSEESGVWESVKNGLMNEIRRLSNAWVLTENGWQLIPLEACLSQGYLSAEDVEEAEGFIVFFTCIYHIHRRSEVRSFLQPMESMWGVSATLLTSMEYRDSLPTSTEEETFLPTVKASSIPG
jgi:hypothetical protein